VHESEPGITVPTLLLNPTRQDRRNVLVLHVAEGGKPRNAAAPSIGTALAANGYNVLSIDVRGVGETDPRGPEEPASFDGYDRTQWTRDCLAIDAAYSGRTMLAMRTLDVTRTVDDMHSVPAVADRPLVLLGEGLGGVWALAAAAFDERVDGVVCVDTLLSYTMLVRSKYHRLRGYFWVPGALHDYDLPDLATLVAPRPVLWLDGIDAMAERVDEAEAAEAIGEWPGSVYAALGVPGRLQIARTDDGAQEQAAEAISEFLQKQWSGADG
jgi:pimeloyl-ACP methyl ester carboxylesterase